jgi:hypothetical protein
VTGIIADVIFLSVSLMPLLPDVGAGVMPAAAFLAQLNDVLAVSDVGVYVKRVLLQRSAGARPLFNAGIGFTVMVNVWAVPEQLTPPLVKVGVTVTVPLMGAVPALVAVNAGRLPAVGPAPRPIAVLELVHE